MFDDIINSLKDEVGGSLMEKLGLSNEDAGKAVDIAGDTVKEVMERDSDGFGLDDILNLFSNDKNNETADNLENNISTHLSQNLTEKMGLSSDMISSIKSMILPILLNLITSKLGGDGNKVNDIFGENIGGLIRGLGGLFK